MIPIIRWVIQRFLFSNLTNLVYLKSGKPICYSSTMSVNKQRVHLQKPIYLVLFFCLNHVFYCPFLQIIIQLVFVLGMHDMDFFQPISVADNYLFFTTDTDKITNSLKCYLSFIFPVLSGKLWQCCCCCILQYVLINRNLPWYYQPIISATDKI